MVMTNATRRTAVLFAFIPILVLYLVYTFRLHYFIPAIATWPTQHQIVTEFSTYMRHRLFPWTKKQDALKQAMENGVRTPFRRHIVAVGDMHGDFGNARKVLQFAGVVDDMGDWTGDVDFFVQTGDIIDRGDDTIKLFTWMDQLRTQAHATGATVLNLMGNHEWMNAIGDWRYVYPSELKTFGTIAARQRMLSSGRIGTSWARNYTTAARLPLHPSLGPPNTPYPPNLSVHFQKESEANPREVLGPVEEDLEARSSDDHTESVGTVKAKRKINTPRKKGKIHYEDATHLTDPLSHCAISFVHGGLSPTFSNLAPFPSKINDLAHTLLFKLQHRKQPPVSPPNPYPGLPLSSTHEEQELYDGNGPLWYRGWAMMDEETVCRDVDWVLQKTGTKRMVMGHTPDFHNIVSRCDGKIIIIDTGISHAYGGVLSALSIHYTLAPIGEDEDKKWLETEIVSALYADRREVIIQDEREIVGDFWSFEHDEWD